ncbi:MAG: hypothetical protein IJI68_04730 [Eggerthellaceae bacterium]|nr:hypothetical protein [Eggerthellaceae bacterium]
MKKFLPLLTALLAACALALCVACSSGTASGSAEASTASSEASAASSEASAAASAAAGAVDPSALEDGEYTVEVTLEGGSGKAYVESPMQINVIEGDITAVVVWSSPNYDQMIVNGEQYLPVPRAGNSTFQIPLAELADELPIQAETTAMSEPHMIDYVIHFDLATLQQA